MKYVITCAAMAAFAGAALAQDNAILTFGFTDLNGAFAKANNTFSATTRAGTSGDVTRTDAGTSTANFLPTFADPTRGMFDADFRVGVSNISVNPFGIGSANGNGTFALTDFNGDKINGVITGTWAGMPGGTIVFSGVLSNIFINEVSGDGQFNGTEGSGFSLNFTQPQPFDGVIVVLSFNPGAGFFNSSFNNIFTLITSRIVPTPASTALLACGGLVMARRRR